MKTFLLTISICFLLLNTVLGQTEPRLEKYLQYVDNYNAGEFVLNVATIYEYTEWGEIDIQTKKYYKDDGTLDRWYSQFYTYNEQNQLEGILQRRYNPDVDLWVSTVWTDYEYDQNGCMTKESKTRNVGGLYEINEYERDVECRITKEIKSRDLGGAGMEIQFIFEYDYFADGVSYSQDIYRKSFNDTFHLDATHFYFFNDHKKLEEYFRVGLYENQDTFFLAKTIYEYDDQQNRTKWSKYQKYPIHEDWDLLSQFFYYNEYDENDFLVSVKTEELIQTDPPSYDPYDDKLFSYEYTCDGLEKVREVISYNTYNTYRYESYYEGDNDCFEIEKVNLEIDAYPNPSQGFVNIKSPILASGNTRIEVFSANGNVLLQKTEISRCELTALDLSELPSGIYIVELSNKNHYANQKIVIGK